MNGYKKIFLRPIYSICILISAFGVFSLDQVSAAGACRGAKTTVTPAQFNNNTYLKGICNTFTYKDTVTDDDYGVECGMLYSCNGAGTKYLIISMGGGSQYTVTASAGAGGVVGPTTQQVASGGSVTITAVPNTGYTVKQWSFGTCLGAGNTCSIDNITSDKTVTVTFEALPEDDICGCKALDKSAYWESLPTGTITWSYDPTGWQGGPGCYGSYKVYDDPTYMTNVRVACGGTVVSPPINGSCGASNHGTFTTAPTTGLCDVGTATPLLGSGPWTWSCTGANGGTTASCSASKAVSQYTVTATAGVGGSVSPTTQQVTSGGSATITATPNTGYTFNGWSGCSSVSGTTCTVSNVTSNKTVTASFSANPTPVNGACGYPNGEEVASKPGLAINDDLCTKGTATLVIGSGPWYWSCNGKNGGTTANCSATKVTVITPTCGVNNKNYAYNATGFVSPTTTGFCAAGPLGVLPGQIAFPSQGGTTYWQCGNGGVMGGNVAYCSATRDAAPVVNGLCGTANKTYPSAAVGYGADTICTSGTASPGSPAFPSAGSSVSWTCNGSGGGSNVSCSATKLAPEPPGTNAVCGNSNEKTILNLPSGTAACSVGTYAGGNKSGAIFAWVCNGVSGGNTAACFAYVDNTPGQCASLPASATQPTAGLCMKGTPSAVTSGSTTWNWSCIGNNDGATVSCSSSKLNIVAGSCGSANNQNYQASTTSYGSDTQCSSGTPTNTSFPVNGGTETWTCNGENGGGNSGACSASRANLITTGQDSGIENCATITTSWMKGSFEACKIIGGWNAAGEIQCQQRFTWLPATTTTPTRSYTQEIIYTNGVETGRGPKVYTPSMCPVSVVTPNGQTWGIDDPRTLRLELNSPSSNISNAFANNTDTNIISVNLVGTTLESQPVTNWGTNGTFSGFSDASKIPADSTLAYNGTSNKALTLSYSKTVTSTSVPNNTFLQIPVTSVTPMNTGGKNISFQAGGTPMVISNVSYNFKKPFIGILEVNNSANTWTGKTTLGTLQEYRLKRNNVGSLGTISNYQVQDFVNAGKVQPKGDGIDLNNTSLSGATKDLSSGAIFYTRVDSSPTATILNRNPQVQINPVEISYTFAGQTVRYLMSKNPEAGDTTPIDAKGDDFLGIRIIGGLQGQGKQEFTGQKANISNLYVFNQRTGIRKNAYVYTRNMNSGDVVNRVKYVEGDFTLSNNTPNVNEYDTLIVMNGNVIIDNDFTPNNLFGIIVIKDQYDISKGVGSPGNQKGNIFITPNVTKINAVIYADGGIVSAKKVGATVIPYTQDSVERTQDLQNQLTIVGSVFTRNSIGGATQAGGNTSKPYMLPGGGATASFDDAMVYDFNYIRRGSDGCDKNNNGTCTDIGEYKDPFVIQYDPRIQTSPLKLFIIGG